MEAKAETYVYLNILRREIDDCSKDEIKEILLVKVGYWHNSAIEWRTRYEALRDKELLATRIKEGVV